MNANTLASRWGNQVTTTLVGLLLLTVGWGTLVYMTHTDLSEANKRLENGMSKIWIGIVGLTVVGGLIYLARREFAFNSN